MESAKWKAAAAIMVALAASGTASLAAYVHRQVQRPQLVQQQRARLRATDAGAPCAALASPPTYLFSAQGGVSLTSPSWLSATRLLASSNRRVSAFDMLTGQDILMENINAVIREQEGVNEGHLEMFFDVSSARLSPDGRWLLWPSGTREAPKWEAMTLDGSERREWDRDKASPAYGGLGGVAWMQDSVHWVEVGQRLQRGCFRAYVRVYNMSMRGVSEFPVRQMPKPDALLPGSPQFIFTTDGRAWMVDSGAATVTPSGVLLSSLDYYQLLPGPDMWTLRRTSFSLQAAHSHYTSDNCKLSPDGQWLVWRDNSDWGNGHTRIILSRPDGTGARTLFEATTFLGLLSWTPDQEKIIFHWQGNNRCAGVPGCDGVYALSLDPLTACSRPFSSHGPQRVASAGPFPVAVRQHRPALTAKVAGR